MSRLLALPPEIVLDISPYLEYTSDLNALAQSCTVLYSILNDEVYKRIHKDLRQPPPTCRHTGLHWAAENGKELCVRRLMASGISPKLFRDNGRNPLILSAANGHTEVLRIFLDHGVDANGWTGFLEKEPRENPLSVAIKAGHLSVIKLLIEYGVELEYDFRKLKSMRYPPTMPMSLATMFNKNEIVELLLEHGCDPCLVPDDVGGENSFLIAAWCNEEAFRLFLRAGVKPDFPDNGNSQLLSAVINGRVGLANYLFDFGADLITRRGLDAGFSGQIPDLEDIYYQFSDISSTYHEMADVLLKRIDVDEIIEKKYLRPMRFLMQGAAGGGYEELLRRFLEVDWPEKHTTDKQDWLYTLTICLSKAVNRGYINIVELMLDNGADPNGAHPDHVEEVNNDRLPALLEAIRRDYVEIVKFLLEKGADPYQSQDLQWPTAFQECISKSPISDAKFQMIQLLVENNCLADPSSFAYSSLISQSVKGGERVFDLVQQHLGVRITPGNHDHQRALRVATCLGDIRIMNKFFDAGFHPNVVSESGQRLLLLAAKDDQHPQHTVQCTVSFLLDHGADIDSQNPVTGMTPLLDICSSQTPTKQTVTAARILLEKGASIFITGKDKEFPLVKAARQNQSDLVKAFVEYFDEKGTPLLQIKNMVEEAIKSSHKAEIRKILCRFYWPKVYPSPAT